MIDSLVSTQLCATIYTACGDSSRYSPHLVRQLLCRFAGEYVERGVLLRNPAGGRQHELFTGGFPGQKGAHALSGAR